MNAVGFYLFAEFHPVVEHENGSCFPTSLEQSASHRFNFCIIGPLHAQLYPLASPFQGQKGRVFVSDVFKRVSDELNRYHVNPC